MKWFITISLILYAVAVPLQWVQADNSTAPDFGPWPRSLANGKARTRKGNR